MDKNIQQRAEEYEAWFKTLLGHLQTTLQTVQVDQTQTDETWEAVHEYLSLLHTEAEVLQQTFAHALQLIQTLQTQRDEALVQRDEALATQQDAYLRGLLMQEEQRLGNDWSAFGVTEEFSLNWLQELLVEAGESEAAEKVAWVEQHIQREVQAWQIFRQRFAHID